MVQLPIRFQNFCIKTKYFDSIPGLFPVKSIKIASFNYIYNQITSDCHLIIINYLNIT